MQTSEKGPVGVAKKLKIQISFGIGRLARILQGRVRTSVYHFAPGISSAHFGPK